MTLLDHRTTTESPARPDRLSRSWAFALGAAWAVLLPLSIALEPAAAAESAPWWGELISLVLLSTIIASFVGFVAQRTWSIGTSFVAASIFATGVFLCPATGHHAFGLWWFGEFAASLALLGLSSVAYLRAR